MFHFAGLSSIHYEFMYGYTDMTLYGLPHSDISGSKPVCGSPKLFAAYRVLRRLLAPRHPPYALANLTIPGASFSSLASPASARFAYRGVTSFAGPFHGLRLLVFGFPQVPQPLPRKAGLGSSLFARHYLGNRYYFLFLQLLRCFTSLGCPPWAMNSPMDIQI